MSIHSRPQFRLKLHTGAALAVLGSVLLLLPAPVLAQEGQGGSSGRVLDNMPMSAGGIGRNGIKNPLDSSAAQKRFEKQAPPPALPGALSDPSRVAAPTRAPTEMSPTEALFDAVNRGDLDSTRDAITRGAELEATNLLGLTPLELSIDLGRNDITFVLVSLRNAGEVAGSGRRRGGTAVNQSAARSSGAAAASAGVKTAPRERVQAASLDGSVKPAAAAPVAVERPASVAATRPVSSGKAAVPVYAADGGVPNPQAGFLGFGQGGSALR